MKKLILIIVIFFASFGLRAEIFGSAGTIKPGVMMFGVEPQINIQPNDVMGYFHLGTGVADRMDVNFKLGLGSAKTYFGGELEYADEMTLGKSISKRQPIHQYIK